MLMVTVMVLAAATAMPADKIAPVETLFRQFGLLGTWASDCKLAASPDNPHVSITTPGAGAVLEDHDLGSGFAINRYSMLTGERLSDELLSVNTIFQPGTAEEERERLVFRVRGTTRRTMFNQPDGGKAHVVDGMVLPGGSKTPVLNKCE
jgi:hypothetical protein